MHKIWNLYKKLEFSSHTPTRTKHKKVT